MIQTVTVKKGKPISKQEIQYALTRARSTYDYAKFILPNGKYITVNFMKDNSYEIATNVREQYQLFYDIKITKTIKSFFSLIDFLYKWLNRLNK